MQVKDCLEETDPIREAALKELVDFVVDLMSDDPKELDALGAMLDELSLLVRLHLKSELVIDDLRRRVESKHGAGKRNLLGRSIYGSPEGNES